MKHKFYFPAFFFVLTFFLMSCTKAISPEADDMEIHFSVGFATPPPTRLTTDADFRTQFDTGDAMGIFIYKRPAATASNIETNELYANNVKAVYQNGNWVTESNLYHTNDGSLLDVYAYYPYTPGAEAQQLKYDATLHMTDFLVASTKGIQKQQGQTVSLLFEHKLALVHLTVHKGQRPIGMYDTFQTYFSGQSGGSYHIGTDRWSQPSQGEVSMQLVGSPYEDTRVYRAWVPAQSLGKGHKIFTFTQTTSGYSFGLEEKLEAATPLQAGLVHRHLSTLGAFTQTHLLYNLYDLYPKYGNPVGLVIEVYNDGKNGIVMSLANYEAPWSILYEATGADDGHDGISNIMKIQARPDWKTQYPAFATCTKLGEGWYLPALHEAYYYLKTCFHTLNSQLQYIPGADLIDGGKAYWTSTEAGDYDAHRILGGNAHTDTREKMEDGQIRPFLIF